MRTEVGVDQSLPDMSRPDSQAPSSVQPLATLIVVDDDEEAERLNFYLRSAGSSGSPARVSSRVRSVDDPIIDLEDGSFRSIVVRQDTADPAKSPQLQRLLALSSDSAVVIVADDAHHHSVAVAATEAGAEDCLSTRELSPDALLRSIELAEARLWGRRRFQKAAAVLADANQELSDFAHIVAHDLREPVRLAQLLADRFIASMPQPTTQTEQLGSLLTQQLRRSERTLLSLLDYVTLRTELPGPADVELEPILRQASAGFGERHGLPSDVITITVEGETRVLASGPHMEKVITHLLDNAIAHHPEREHLRIDAILTRVGRRVRLTISDNGVGVPAQARERVFAAMARLRSDSEGVGLGLAICRRILDAYGGAIWIASSNRLGTAVVVELPAVLNGSNVHPKEVGR